MAVEVADLLIVNNLGKTLERLTTLDAGPCSTGVPQDPSVRSS